MILKHKNPYDENYDWGYGHRTWIKDIYYANGSIYQKRKLNSKWSKEKNSWVESETREVRFPVSKKALKELNVPDGTIIHESPFTENS